MFAGKKSAQIREILISESTWEEMTCLFAPSLKEVAAKSKLTDTTVSIPITASYYVYDTNKVKSGALEATALINVKYD
ncbi:TPA: fimbrial protein [Escherichia coli]|nr:fimbrial protein [Escherichia coli]